MVSVGQRYALRTSGDGVDCFFEVLCVFLERGIASVAAHSDILRCSSVAALRLQVSGVDIATLKVAQEHLSAPTDNENIVRFPDLSASEVLKAFFIQGTSSAEDRPAPTRPTHRARIGAESDEEATSDEEAPSLPRQRQVSRATNQMDDLAAQMRQLWGTAGLSAHTDPPPMDDFTRLQRRMQNSMRQSTPGQERPGGLGSGGIGNLGQLLHGGLPSSGSPHMPQQPAPGDPNVVMQTLLMQLLSLQMQKKDKDEDELTTQNAKAFRRLDNMRRRTRSHPRPVIQQYVRDVMETLGASEGDAWHFAHMTEKIEWNKMKGLHRVHFHLSHALTWLLAGEHEAAGAYLVQLLRSLHQVALDNGSWQDASLLLPVQDPIQKREFGATERELETVAAYRKALNDLRRSRLRGNWNDQPDNGDRRNDQKNNQRSGNKDGKGGGKD
eukprot:TRINITY_DN112214_c0_g1_i1.p2 TRINITY_DN112214_c0_g1~~TRINITY_DN112214_c0_g1_i1.p2  ORF type:complete len:440 (-),score=61.56 TRINITY_DN112214_c0_g1_i1:575-1894(-)